MVNDGYIYCILYFGSVVLGIVQVRGRLSLQDPRLLDFPYNPHLAYGSSRFLSEQKGQKIKDLLGGAASVFGLIPNHRSFNSKPSSRAW